MKNTNTLNESRAWDAWSAEISVIYPVEMRPMRTLTILQKGADGSATIMSFRYAPVTTDQAETTNR
jgi:hypothetical protein